MLSVDKKSGRGRPCLAPIRWLPALLAVAAQVHGAPPTFSKEIAPILYRNCVSCHRAGEMAAAQSLVSYADAKHWAGAIKRQVLARTMPPWPADPAHSLKFRNDRRLRQEDIDTLVAWVNDGSAPGNPADLPPLPDDSKRWLYPGGRPPDAVLTLPEISVAANGEIPYVLQRVRVPLREDKWIAAMQVRPGNPALVHHMGITEVSVAAGVRPEDLDEFAKVARQMGVPDDALTAMRPAVVDPQNVDAYDMLGVYTPGTTFEIYEDDTAKLLKSGSNLYVNFNIHYTTTGKPETSRSELALWFRSAPPKHQLFRAPAAVNTILANDRQLLTDDPGTKAEGTDFAIPPIPPYAGNYELRGVTAYTKPVTLYQLQPHAHLRGKDFRYVVVYPDGREVTVLTVPAYDFHWQLAYVLETPLQLPAGSKLEVIAHYDNSANNKHMREVGVDARHCGPDQEAYFRRQNQSWHEMFSPLIQYSIDIALPGEAEVPGTSKRPTNGAGAAHPLPLVEAVGCLVRGPGDGWSLTHASAPAATASQSTSAAALRTAATKPWGAASYTLIGAEIFDPQREARRKVAVKGVFIGDEAGTRLNVTSLQKVAGACF